MSHPVRRRATAGRPHLLATLVAAAALAAPAPAAHAADGTFTQILCADPDTGRGVVGNDGAFPAGLRIHRSGHAHFDRAQSQAKCSGTVTASRGVVLGTAGTSFTVADADSGLVLRYEAAAGVTFDGGVVYRQSQMGPSWDDYWSIGINRAWSDWQWASPQYDMCVSRWTPDCRGKGSSDPFSVGNRVAIGREAEVNAAGKPLNGFNLLLKCAGGNCPADPGDFLRVFGGKLRLKDPTAPRATTAPSGSLVGDAPLAGWTEATFDAVDSGSGVYRTRVVVDGEPRAWHPAHANGGQCQDIGAGDGDPYEFASSNPCRTEVNTAVRLDTTTVADGTHAIKLQAEDAAGNVATLLSDTIVVDNVPPPSAIQAPAIAGEARDGATLTAQASEWDDHGAEGDVAVTRVWQRCDADRTGCVDLPDATGASLALDDRDVGSRLRVVETAANSEGETASASAMTDVVVDLPAPSNVGLPAVLGGTRRGSVLVADLGAWNDHEAPGDPVITRQWQRCRHTGAECQDIAGATGPTYALGTADLNRRLQVVETAANAEGATSATSPQTGRVTREDGTLPPDNNGEDDDGDGQIDEVGESVPLGGGTGGSSAGGANGRPAADGRDGADGRTDSSSTSTSSSSHSTTVLLRNGENASRRARLVVGFRDAQSSIATIAYGKGAAVVGRLVDESGRPITGAAIDVTHTTAVRGATAAPRPGIVSGLDGRFAYAVPKRTTSGTIRFSYAYERGGQPVAQDELDVRVKAAARLSVRLKGAVVSYRGVVLSRPVPRGKLVILQGRVKGKAWQTFASRRTNARGAFRGRYRLKLRRPGRKLQFRARVVAESGFPFLTNHSRAVTRTVR